MCYNQQKIILFLSSAGCEWTTTASIHRLTDGVSFPPQFFIGDVFEESRRAHGDQEQHEEAQLHDQAEQGQLGQ